ncbi:hypothetical protein GRI44_02885 [Altererythrobacter confluentis]|uniref:Uncharacterized protein n=1 Tax=Allopontixanthobacter confluentis TaxID=1849021 RepID=A0A6L7GCK6_9SPHN|nr:hypothetical protein [Allopontixanthobacter confluentis]MXP13699.1 hypothetical protein [Allopontixanthobacter confluentis]
MRIDPIVRALRSEPAPQRKAQTQLLKARSQWQKSDRNRAILADLTKYGSGCDLRDCASLDALFSHVGPARIFAASLENTLVPVLAEHPLGHVPFRHQYAGSMAIIQIAAHASAALSLVLYEQTDTAALPTTVCFTDSDRHEMALAGSAHMQHVCWTAASEVDAKLSSRPFVFAKGDALSLAGIHETKQVLQVDGSLVVLRLSRTAPTPLPSVEFRLSDGALVHQASGDRRDSRHELMLALLGKMGRVDAAPVLAEMTVNGSDALRWQALRECLALNTASGFAALSALSRKPGDSLAADAAALKHALVTAHPALARMEAEFCPV